MTQETTKEFLTSKALLRNGKSVFVISGDFGTVTLNDLLEEYAQQKVAAERERAGKLVEALKEISLLNLSHNETPLDYAIDRKIKQTLNEYDTATK